MAKVKILIEGYAREEDDTEFASSTTTLIQEGDLNIIIDPGMNRELLLDVLRKEDLSPDKIMNESLELHFNSFFIKSTSF